MSCTVDASTTEAMDLEVLAARITEGAGHLAAATGAWLGLVEEFDRREGWAVWGVKSCAHWLSWRCGIGLVAGREHVRVARALAGLPVTRAALAAGTLSYSKARALTRVATPETEQDLVDVAVSCTGAQLDQLVGGLRKAGSLDDVNARHEARSVTWSLGKDGSLVLKGRFSPEDGALIIAALEAARDNLDPDPENASAEAPGDGEHGPECYPPRFTAQRNADALVVLAETMLASGPAPGPGGARHQVNIHTDLDALLDDAVAAQKPARIEDGPQLHPETLRRLCCDSGAVIVAHHEPNRSGRRRGTWMDVGRRTRTVPAALRRALVLRDGGCRFPSCTETRFVDAHHVIFWSRGGPTVLWNLILVCRRHHRYVHEGGFRIGADGVGGFTFYRPDGVRIPDAPSTSGGDATKIPDLHAVDITPTTVTPNWNGDHLDLDYAVSVLTQTPRDASAEALWPPANPSLN